MATEDNLAAVLHGMNDLRVEKVPFPEFKENEVLLRMSQVGICGSDMSLYKKGRMGSFIVKSPNITGHEGSGVVMKCGSAVKDLKPGDRVCIKPTIHCRMCDHCEEGRNNLCRNLKAVSLPPFQGMLARYHSHDANNCFKLPDHVSLEEGSLVEPMSVAVHACRRGNVTYGSTVLICGSGSIGLLSLLAAKAMGATKICVTDIVDHKLKIAKQMGADATLNVSSGNLEDLSKRVANLLDGKVPDITIECTGAESSTGFGILATRSGGKVVLAGIGAPYLNIPLTDAILREVDLIGCFTFSNCFHLALEMISSGRVDVKPLITHRFKLEDVVQAFETFKNQTAQPIKVSIVC